MNRKNKDIKALLNNNIFVKIFELLLVFLAAFAIIKILLPFAGDNLVAYQAVIWLANVVMLLLIWLGQRLRGQTFKEFGLSFSSVSRKEAIRIFLLSLVVFGLAIAGFILGSVIMANITGIPESADMSGYEYMKDNIFMLILTLFGVYIVSSFGEEIIYRAFLINRLSDFGINIRYGQAIAVLISAIIFGTVHYSWGPMGMVQTGFMGLVLGLCYLKLKKRIWILIFAHAYMDTILMVQMYMASN